MAYCQSLSTTHTCLLHLHLYIRSVINCTPRPVLGFGSMCVLHESIHVEPCCWLSPVALLRCLPDNKPGHRRLYAPVWMNSGASAEISGL